MNVTYKVAPGRCILTPANNNLPSSPSGRMLEGTIIPDGMFTGKKLSNKIRDGFIVAAGAQLVDNFGEPIGGTLPGKEIDAEDAARTSSIEDAKTNAPVLTDKSVWVFDPEGLRGTELEALQILIYEKDELIDIEQFKTAEEAIEFLSKDFVRTD